MIESQLINDELTSDTAVDQAFQPAGRDRLSGDPEQVRREGAAVPCAQPCARPDDYSAQQTADQIEADALPPGPPHQRKPEIPEMLSRQGATALAARLEKYWYDLGYPSARFWAAPISERFDKVGTYELYRVACNLINGLPPRYREDQPRRR
ncbi:hypothetical protein [Rhodopseudomonas sp.]|uniref:hypothetical protein n=1 Tax=Rhodopseudomonas sp. TaxID=1078 RepID=UPI0039E66278